MFAGASSLSSRPDDLFILSTPAICALFINLLFDDVL